MIVSEPPSSIFRSGEKAPRALQSIGVNTARENFAGGRRDSIVGAAKARERVEQNNNVALVLHQPLGLLENHFRDLNVALRRLIEGRADHFAFHGTLHVRDFFRALVDQQHDEGDFRMIDGDGIGDGLQQIGRASCRERVSECV